METAPHCSTGRALPLSAPRRLQRARWRVPALPGESNVHNAGCLHLHLREPGRKVPGASDMKSVRKWLLRLLSPDHDNPWPDHRKITLEPSGAVQVNPEWIAECLRREFMKRGGQ